MADPIAIPDETAESRTRLRAAKRKNKALVEARRAANLERTNALLESIGNGGDWVGDFYQMLDRFNQAGAGFMGATNISDRRYGRNWPIYLNEIDLQVARMPSRILTATNCYAIGMLEGWTSFIGGEGFVRTVAAKNGMEARVPKPILAKLQAVIEDFAFRNQWDGAEQPGLEEELIQRPEIDGEFGLCLSVDDAGQTWATTFEPEQLTQPPGSDDDYLFGILTEKGNPQKPEKYWLRGWNTDLHGDEYDADQIIHFKTNCQRQMKRGYPSFTFSTADTFTLANDLRQALGIGGKIQAGIVGVRQHATSTKEQVRSMTAAMKDYEQRLSNGSTIPVTISRAGEFQDIPEGMQYVDPPNAQNAPAHIQILHACLRAASVRYNAPDWLGSGDASANTYDNSVATGSTFGRRILREQKRFQNTFHRIFWWALDTRCTRAGVITAVGPDGTVYRMPWDELKKLIELKITPPPPEQRDKDKEADRLTKLVEAKLMSPQQAIVELGDDVEETQQQIKTWEEEMGPPASGQQLDPDGNPLRESKDLREAAVPYAGYPYVAYQARHDGKARETHVALESYGIGGTNIYRADDPVILKFWAPWEHECRCKMKPLTLEEAAAGGIPEAIDWLETGIPPANPTYVDPPPFAPPAGWIRESFDENKVKRDQGKFAEKPGSGDAKTEERKKLGHTAKQIREKHPHPTAPTELTKQQLDGLRQIRERKQKWVDDGNSPESFVPTAAERQLLAAEEAVGAARQQHLRAMFAQTVHAIVTSKDPKRVPVPAEDDSRGRKVGLFKKALESVQAFQGDVSFLSAFASVAAEVAASHPEGAETLAAAKSKLARGLADAIEDARAIVERLPADQKPIAQRMLANETATLESLVESFDETKVKRDHGKFAEKPGSKDSDKTKDKSGTKAKDGPKHGSRASALRAKREELLAALKQERIDTFNAVKADAHAANDRANEHAASLGEHMGTIGWDSGNEDEEPFTRLEEAINDYDPDAPAAERFEALKTIEENAREAMEVEQQAESAEEEARRKRIEQLRSFSQSATAEAQAYIQKRDALKASDPAAADEFIAKHRPAVLAKNQEADAADKEVSELEKMLTDALPAEMIAENKTRLQAIVAGARAARHQLKTYVQHRKEMQAIKAGESMDVQESMRDDGAENWALLLESLDESKATRALTRQELNV